MPRVKVPDRIRELAAELELNLEGEADFTDDPEELIAWMRHVNDGLRSEENEHRDDIDNELDELESEMMEQIDDNA
jgi:hypothetical protein